MEKAFNRVWHDGLLYKFFNTSLPPVLIRIIASFLRDRSFCVAVEESISAPCPIRAGVPQGNCLSPCLFAAFTDNIPTLRGHLKEWEDVILAFYIDDSAYFVSSHRADLAARKIQRGFDLLPEWLDSWRMAVNIGKTAALLTGRLRNMSTKLRLRRQDVEWKSYIRTPPYSSILAQNVLRMFAGAGWYVKNNIIAKDLRVLSIKDFVRIQARRLFNNAHEGPISSHRNLTPQYERRPGGHQLPQDFLSSPHREDKASPTGANR
ncbi:RNA-directed DNA polymerase from mobile element jockey [Eumeta japonica]|uniref:RNA-directed DNA polymerase from mobile element jockey n=1 Tax=Eumeta variegata TaxID=151549 RepID=A0A4C1V555_EUMVA|nr:RNA-directed DNA polymerase from mobile element jockey [Eumeta japonica]